MNLPRPLAVVALLVLLLAGVALASRHPEPRPPDPSNVQPTVVEPGPMSEDPGPVSLEGVTEPEEAPPPVNAAPPTIEVAFVLDTTGSMGGLLAGAKEKIWSIASRIAKGKPRPKLRVALVAYRDVGDAYVTQVTNLTDDMDLVYQRLSALRAEGGGDWPEHVGRAMHDAVNGLSWSQDGQVARMIFLVGDAPPQDYGDGITATKWAKRAKARGIAVSAIRCGSAPDTELSFREMARVAGGSFFSIDQEGGMVAVHTPYDEDLTRLNREIAARTVYGGGRRARAAAEEKREAVASLEGAAAADRLGYLASGGGKGLAPAAAPPGVTDLAAAPSKVAELADDELPEPLAALAPAERKWKLEQLAKERTAYEAEVVELAKKRQAWIEANVEKKADSFDENVMRAVRKEAKDVGVRY